MESAPTVSHTHHDVPTARLETAPTSTKIFKRKFDEALHTLDAAVHPSDTVEDDLHSSASKRTRLTRSIYSTLSKYGLAAKDKEPIKRTAPLKEDVLVKKAPKLAAILRRAASNQRKDGAKSASPSFVHPNSFSATSDYRPSSIPAFLSRLATYKLATYSNKPAAVDAVAASKCGWINDGKDRLVCGICSVSWVVAGREGMSRDAASALVEKQRASLVDMHKVGCPWKIQQCDPDIYRIPLKTPMALAKEIKQRAVDLDGAMNGIIIRHPLTATQLQSLQLTCTEIRLNNPLVTENDDQTEVDGNASPSLPSDMSVESSEAALLTALFGWSLVPALLSNITRPTTPSISRANSVAPLTAPPTPTNIRSIPSTGSIPSSPFKPSISRLGLSAASVLQIKTPEHDSRLLQCLLCQRRIGLWAFQNRTESSLPASSASSPSQATNSASPLRAPTQRQFDLLKEHRSYCPYVVRSTEVPSLPASASNLEHARSPSTSSLLSHNGNVMEGWKAVLTLVLRTSLHRKQQRRLERNRSARIASSSEQSQGGPQQSADEQPMELDGIDAMVQGVKARGGRDLLRYIKGLLG